jgi:hypothetical protein
MIASYYFRVEKMLMLMLMCPLTIKGGEDVDVYVNVSPNYRVEKMLMLILMCPLTIG